MVNVAYSDEIYAPRSSRRQLVSKCRPLHLPHKKNYQRHNCSLIFAYHRNISLAAGEMPFTDRVYSFIVRVCHKGTEHREATRKYSVCC